MYLIFLIVWLVLNGCITAEIVLTGLILSAVLLAFCCKFLGYSLKRERTLYRRTLRMLHYIAVLVFEIIKANLDVMHMIMTAKYEVEPCLVTLTIPLKTEWARVLLANSITLTPGTITVNLRGDRYTVHCLDKTLAEGIEDSIFVTLLRRMEERE
ncbi:MAG: Na+/H+ antiporter subunit E [Butyricicoccus sp.]